MIQARANLFIKARLFASVLPALLLLVPLTVPYRVAGQTESIPSSRIDLYIQQQMPKTHLPGLAVAIVKGQDIVYLKGFGSASLGKGTPVTPQTIFDLASCSKSFTALAVLLLWQDGAIDLDNPYASYVPEFRLVDTNISSRITVRELLLQTSGLPGTISEPLGYYSGRDAMKQMLTAAARIQPDRVPGVSFEYTNLNYALLGALVERISGKPFEDFVQERIFTPLGMDNSTLYPEVARGKDRADGHQLFLGKVVTRNIPIYRSMIPAGWIMSSVEDMAKWVIANLNDGATMEKQAIPPGIIPMMHTTGVTFEKNGQEAGYGMGWFTGTISDGSPVIWHGGDTPNFLSETILFPQEKLGVVMLANGQTYPNAHQIAIDIASIALGKQFALPAAPWWASWKSIDNISIYATILSSVLFLGLIPYSWWQWRVIHRLRQQKNERKTRSRRIKVWGIVLPATSWFFLGILIAGTYLVFEMVFGFNVFRTVARFGNFAPPGVIVAAVAIVVTLFLWIIALSVTTIFRTMARATPR